MAGQCTMWRLSCAEAFQHLTDVIVLLRFGQVVRRDVLLFESKLLVDVSASFAQHSHGVSVAHCCRDVQARQSTLQSEKCTLNCTSPN